MYRRVADFLADWDEESARTLRLLGALAGRAQGDAVLAHRPREGARSLGEIAWHLPISLASIGTQAGLRIDAPAKGSPAPESSAPIRDAYRRAASDLREQVAAWDDAMLEVEDLIYGERWPRGRTLRILLAHEIHHRGQMTALMRVAGLTLPALYGPSSDEASTS